MTLRHPLLRIASIRELETAAMAQLPAGALMERAGAAAATAARELLPESFASATILVLAGPGNNGGDALETAARLAFDGANVFVLMPNGASNLPADAHAALLRARGSPVHFLATLPVKPWSLVIDGLFGIGLTRPIDAALSILIRMVNALDCPVLALDVPSGLNADTGTLIGTGGSAIRATHTVTFIADKPGLHTAAGRDHAGQVIVETLGLSVEAADCPIELTGVAAFASAVQARNQDSHKGSFGDVAVIGGADGMAGATLLAARAALHAGAGRVFAGFVGATPSHDPFQPELMCRRADTLAFDKAVFVIGPGLGVTPAAAAILQTVLQSNAALVLDADALNLISADAALAQAVTLHTGAVLMTPHPLEAARLLRQDVATIQSDRMAAANTLAQRFACIVILKGSGSVVARPDGALAINPTGNPALATGGTGDVLAGLCGALLAQGWPVWQAALGAAWLHGQAADELVRNGIGPIGLCASELLPQVRRELNRIVARLRPPRGRVGPDVRQQW